MTGSEALQVETCVITRLEQRGTGVKGNPIRRITQVWTLDGALIAEYDPLLDPTSVFNQGIGR